MTGLCVTAATGTSALCRNAGGDGVSLQGWGIIRTDHTIRETFRRLHTVHCCCKVRRVQQKSNPCYKIPQTDHAPFHPQWHTFISFRGSAEENAVTYVCS